MPLPKENSIRLHGSLTPFKNCLKGYQLSQKLAIEIVEFTGSKIFNPVSFSNARQIGSVYG